MTTPQCDDDGHHLQPMMVTTPLTTHHHQCQQPPPPLTSMHTCMVPMTPPSPCSVDMMDSVLKSGLVCFFCLFWHQPDCDQFFSVSENGQTVTGLILTSARGCPTQPDCSCDWFFTKTRYVSIFTTNSYLLICCVFQIAQVRYSFSHMCM